MSEPFSSDKDILAECRKEITALDEQIVALLHKRAAVCLKVGEYKKAVGNIPVLQPDREARLLEHLLSITGEMPKEQLHSIYSCILAASRELQQAICKL